MNWLLAHFDTLRESLVRLARQPFATGLNVIVIGIALSLPVGFYLGIDNLQAFSRQLSSDPQVSIFMAMDAGQADVSAVERRLRAHPEVGRVDFVAREQALAKLKRSAGLADVLADLERNPLPDAFVVTARSNDPATLEALRDQAARWPKVEHVQLDAEWARRLDAALGVGRMLVTLLAALLALALVAVTFNTIRLQILTRRDEIEVSKLIGATNPFIRRPFLYLGALQGLGGGCAAWVIVTLAMIVLNVQLAELTTLYGTAFKLQPLTAADSAVLLLFSAALGWLGAWLSVSRHLWQIEPQ
ncbi:MAG TPA: permease-like cell division protein FtsX [Burkholderiales bacterium]|nr:permease-like cell division protein FtsX [Burkholderiales bacterium]